MTTPADQSGPQGFAGRPGPVADQSGPHGFVPGPKPVAERYAADPPPPPPGPGVMPPFTAPPADRSRKSLWIGLGAGAVTLVLCCVGGVIGFGLLIAGSNQQIRSTATQVVGDYLDALTEQEYDAAYRLLCPALKRGTTLSDFAGRERSRPRPLGYQLGRVEIGNAVVVPADVRYDSGTVPRTFELRQAFGSQDLLICKIT